MEMAIICRRADFLVVLLMSQLNFLLQKKLLLLVGVVLEHNMFALLRLRTIQLCTAMLSVQAFIMLLSLGFTKIIKKFIQNTKANNLHANFLFENLYFLLRAMYCPGM